MDEHNGDSEQLSTVGQRNSPDTFGFDNDQVAASVRLQMRFLVQQVISVLALPVELVALLILVQPFPVIRRAVFTVFVGDVLIVLIFASGPVLGYWIPRARNYASARWTWIAPTAVFLALFIWDWTLFGLRVALAESFDPAEKGDESGLLVVLITFPVVSAVTYSIGAAFGYARMSPKEKAEAEYERHPETRSGWLR